MAITPAALANKMAALKKNLSNKVGVVDSSPVVGIKHSSLAMWYALQVGFDSAAHDPNKLAKFLVVKYEQDHRHMDKFHHQSQQPLRERHRHYHKSKQKEIIKNDNHTGSFSK